MSAPQSEVSVFCCRELACLDMTQSSEVMRGSILFSQLHQDRCSTSKLPNDAARAAIMAA